MKRYFIAIALAIFFYGLINPALGISVSFSSEKGGEKVSSSAVYDLDESTRLKGSAALGDGAIAKELSASGWGKNRISISSSANGLGTGSEMESSGEFSTAASSGASDNGAFISQNTDIAGSYGGINYYADAPDNIMVISSGFEGNGDLSASVVSSAGESALISGNVNALGVDMLDDESMQIIGSGDISMSVEGLSNEGQGSFGLSAANAWKEPIGSDTSAMLSGPAITTTGGRSRAYTLLGYRWNQKDPQLKWVVKNDKYMRSERLTADSVKRAVEGASNTWDDATNQDLFADQDLVTVDSKVATEKYNKINTINWKPVSCTGCLAYARTYYSLKKVDGYYSALDSDIVFNTKYSWSADENRKGVDVESVALHEIGHTLGLGDLYGRCTFRGDTDQVMHYYNGIQRNLGNGDKTGIWRLYK